MTKIQFYLESFHMMLIIMLVEKEQLWKFLGNKVLHPLLGSAFYPLNRVELSFGSSLHFISSLFL